MRSRLDPVKKVARMIRDHLWGIVNAMALRTTNAGSESVNSKVQRVTRDRLPEPRTLQERNPLPPRWPRSPSRACLSCPHEFLMRPFSSGFQRIPFVTDTAPSERLQVQASAQRCRLCRWFLNEVVVTDRTRATYRKLRSRQ